MYFLIFGCIRSYSWHAGSLMAHRLSCPTAHANLAPQPGIKPPPSALEGGFSITGPPGNP